MLRTETVERTTFELLKMLMQDDMLTHRIYSMQDIAAMKLVAISQNGTRLKDFVDVAFLSEKMSLKEMLDAFEIKYPKTNKISAIKGMTYFNDIDFSAKIELINGEFKWKEIEKRLIKMVKYPDKKF